MIAKLADGTELRFPDNTPPAVVQMTVKKYLSQSAKGTLQPQTQPVSPFQAGTKIAMEAVSPVIGAPLGAAAGLGHLAARGVSATGRGLQETIGRQVEQSAFERAKAGVLPGYRIPPGTPSTNPLTGLPFAVAGRALELGSKLIPQTKAEVALQAAAGPALGIAGKLASTTVKPLSQLIRATSAIPENSARLALTRTDDVFNAPTVKIAQDIYSKAVEGLSGLKDLGKTFKESFGFSNSKLLDLTSSAADKVATRELTRQEALLGYQAANNLLARARISNPEVAPFRAKIMEAKNLLEKYLENSLGPKFAKANDIYKLAKTKEEFSTLFPKNKNMSVSALRSLSGLALMAGGAAVSPALATGGLAFSPKITGLAIRGAKGAFAAGKPLARAAIQYPEFAK